MGHRLSKISTRTGDDGSTGLGDGTRVQKDDTRIAAIGDVDELNSQLGVLLGETLPGDVRAALFAIQHDLFDLGGELCIPGHSMIEGKHLARIDGWIAEYNATLPPLKEIHLAGWIPRGCTRARQPHGMPARGTLDRRARTSRSGQRCTAALREPLVRPAVRACACAEPGGGRHRRAVGPRALEVSLTPGAANETIALCREGKHSIAKSRIAG